MNRSKQGQIMDLLMIIIGVLLSVIYICKAEYLFGLTMLGLSIYSFCGYKVKYKYSRLN